MPPAGASAGLPGTPEDGAMTDHVYKVVELVGTSKKGIDDAIETAITRAGATLRHLRWFEVIQIRGAVGADGKVDHTQVTLKAGFTLEGG
jgi:flavin-binding protein dodecin